eukprot:7373467-Prymnesium_polylepis.1
MQSGPPNAKVVPQTAFNGPPFRLSCITKLGGLRLGVTFRTIPVRCARTHDGCDVEEEIGLERCIHACL